MDALGQGYAALDPTRGHYNFTRVDPRQLFQYAHADIAAFQLRGAEFAG